MSQGNINVKPIKSREVLINFSNELLRNKHGQRDYTIFMFGVFTGLRISDILNLKVEDVKGKLKANIIEQKTGKKRTLNLMQLTNQIIKYLDEEHDGESEWLFPSPRDNTKHLATHQFYKIMQKTANFLDLDYIGTHTLRKTFGYTYYQKTKDLTALMKILNHSSQSVTLRYIGIEEEELQSSLDEFNPFQQ
ncbi:MULTISPECIES: tyrosine-type recombinase/integrase [Enterococcus]|nr:MULTISPECIES: tyrosine-type recombinase/integrase [Enterococcus]MDC0751907.1 tyrosine-type recombinase/integrase [Enterococcus innesii]MDC0775995.1 tyrosine-type recombinase/integrase [Enterococcus innesii]MDC0780865.1 tyrosine-type recombinase/integrase [Enterococcus innesii]MDC0782622.1 tyrosine-type recombinase/integrase [Enterococcus innesii]QGR83064.1 tyrosine-type recombinase/integrase [Enterococcus gallinarum]